MSNEVIQKKLSDLKPVKSESLDLQQFHNKPVKIVSADIIQVPSRFTPLVKGSQTDRLPQWVLKVQSEVVATVGEGNETIEFKASEIFNLVQDDDGNLIGYPENEQSNIMKFMKDIRANTPEAMIGKMATIKAVDKIQQVDGKPLSRTFLKFKY